MDHARIDWNRRTWNHAMTTMLTSTSVAVASLSLPRSMESSQKLHRRALRQQISMENHSMASASLRVAYYSLSSDAAAVCHRREMENLSYWRIFHWIIRLLHRSMETDEIVVASLHRYSSRCWDCHCRQIHRSSSAFASSPCCLSHTNYYTVLRRAISTWVDGGARDGAASCVALDRRPWGWVARLADVRAAAVVDRHRVSWFSADDQGADHLSHDFASVARPCLCGEVASVLALSSPACGSLVHIRDCLRAYNICVWWIRLR